MWITVSLKNEWIILTVLSVKESLASNYFNIESDWAFICNEIYLLRKKSEKSYANQRRLGRVSEENTFGVVLY
jgi:hypothetical protein